MGPKKVWGETMAQTASVIIQNLMGIERRTRFSPVLLVITTRRMAIANGTCVSFCNQPKAHYSATSRESRRYVVAYSRFAGKAFGYTSRESKAHFGLPWDYRGKCYMGG